VEVAALRAEAARRLLYYTAKHDVENKSDDGDEYNEPRC
jgi:hypothetical protein